jgi:hypothetical protein
LLRYLENKDIERYRSLIEKLGIRVWIRAGLPALLVYIIRNDWR